MMKVLRAIGRFFAQVLTEGGPPSVGQNGNRFLEQSSVEAARREGV